MEIKTVPLGVNLHEWCEQNEKKNILSEWDYENNSGVFPSDFAPKSGKIINWICNYGHQYKMKIADKTRGRSCPYCTGKKVLVGFNDLQTLNSTVCLDWDYENNNGLTPKDFTAKSGKTVNWSCHICGHKWNSKISNRSNGAMCPECAKKVRQNSLRKTIASTKGSMVDFAREYVNEWDYKKNIGIDRESVPMYSNVKYWWKCSVCGHEWETSPNTRSKGHGCPECSRRRKESRLQEKIRKYIVEKYKYAIVHERKCSLLPKNPKTHFPMPYDNDVLINGLHLIIETMGEQHFKITNFVKQDAIKMKITPEESLEYIKWKDEYKKQYALSHGYYYLAIPYTTEKDESYKIMIDSKIHEILSFSPNDTKLLPHAREEMQK